MSRGVSGWVVCALAMVLAAPACATDTVYYYYTDALHSAVAVTDAQGNVIERTNYAPYGQVLNRDLRDGPGYGGHAEDPETQLVYMQQRYYDAQSGRFLSVDPVAATDDGGNFNRYAYANDNPYRYMDPDGRCTGSNFENVGCDSPSLHVTYFVTPSSKLYAAPGPASSHPQSPQSSVTANPGSSQQAKSADGFHFDSFFTGDKKPTFSGVAAFGLGIVAHKTPGPGNDEVAFTPAGLGLEATATWHLADFKFNFSNAKTSPAYMSAIAGRAGFGLVGGLEIRYTPPGKLEIDITGGLGAAADAHLFDIGTKVDHSDGN